MLHLDSTSATRASASRGRLQSANWNHSQGRNLLHMSCTYKLQWNKTATSY